MAHVDAGYFKSFVHGRIAWPVDQPGAWHLPADASDDYCDQIVAESRVVKANGAVIWVRSRKANHYLDCEALNAAAAHLLNVHSLTRGRAPAAAEHKPDDRPQPPQPAQPAPVDPNVAFRTGRREWLPTAPRSGFVNRWKL